MNEKQLKQLNDLIRSLGYRARDIKNNAAHVASYISDAESSTPEVVVHAEQALPVTLAAIIRDAKLIAEALPELEQTQSQAGAVNDDAADIKDRARQLKRLGMVVRVRYVGPTNTKGGRWIADVQGDDDAARVYVSSHLHETDEATRLEAAERCLAKWHGNRVAWWKANVGEKWQLPLPVITSVGHSGDAYLFFTK